ncbi:FYVE-domain-containing protein [Lojkania enalia]|uniref:FYVE-domain-containing protein n=1 Tax=Lojkania enalia TaxID=147567 RepID=A0A9P4KBB1_9PLEO|nr:FYVE-domain-containing protein [Didymosphaeria enalia]
MSSGPQSFDWRDRSPSTSASSKDDADEQLAPRTRSLMHTGTGRRQGRVFSQSSPALGSLHDGPGPNTAADSDSAHRGYPQRVQSHGAVASHFLPQPPDTYGGQTWADFLRESRVAQSSPPPPSLPPLTGPPPQNPSSRFALPALPSRSSETSSIPSRSSSDRKRRLTAPESPMRQPNHARSLQDGPGATPSEPLISVPSIAPNRPPLPSFPSRSSAGSRERRRESDIVLPPWQPDSEVSHCPVCGSQFTFFYRKHHCRKCGRVVCSACSPHRITIPRQFIVHPPNDMILGANIIDLTGDDDESGMSSFGPFRNPALGGGEEVRVCNPCVPDPNYSPPPQYAAGQGRQFPSYYSSHRPPFASIGPPAPPPRGHRGSQSLSSGSHTVGRDQTHLPRAPFSEERTSYNGTRTADLWLPAQPPSVGQRSPSQFPPAAEYLPGPDINYNPHSAFPQGHHHRHRHHHSFSARDSDSVPRPGSRMEQISSQSVPPQPQPRRQIAEEDECPVCLRELPPKGPDGNEDARTQHIVDCIAQHSASPPPAPPNPNQVISTSLPSQRTRGMSTAGTGDGTSPATGNGEGSSSRVSLSRFTMFPYIATEKDCVDEDGSAAECVICLEDFEAGQKMARLACWCKFHEKCIRSWWEKKGRGNCPTHQLHD